MRVLIDTSTFLWAVDSPELLSVVARTAFSDSGFDPYLSAMSISEIAIKQGKGKLDFAWQDVVRGIADLDIKLLPYTALHAQRLFGLPLHHKDPFDRQIIAQALAEAMPVVTVDPYFRLNEGIEVLW